MAKPYCALTPDEKKSRRASTLRWRRGHKLAVKAHNLRQAYGISLEDWRRLNFAQGGVCAGCFFPAENQTLSVDHDHATGQVRGLLCAPCNSAVGMLKECPERARSILKYIEERCQLTVKSL